MASEVNCYIMIIMMLMDQEATHRFALPGCACLRDALAEFITVAKAQSLHCTSRHPRHPEISMKYPCPNMQYKHYKHHWFSKKAGQLLCRIQMNLVLLHRFSQLCQWSNATFYQFGSCDGTNAMYLIECLGRQTWSLFSHVKVKQLDVAECASLPRRLYSLCFIK